jgi:branched-chain amino acid transport system substrate-binding protein
MKLKTFLRTVLSSLLILIQTGLATAESKFDVGLVIPLTGPTADFGIAIQNSIELAQKDRPELFTNIKFHFEDAQSNPSSAVSAFNELAAVHKVKLSLTFGVAFCKALAPIAENRKIPLVGLCLDPSVAANRRYVIRFKNTTDEIMKLEAAYLNKTGVKKI